VNIAMLRKRGHFPSQWAFSGSRNMQDI